MAGINFLAAAKSLLSNALTRLQKLLTWLRYRLELASIIGARLLAVPALDECIVSSDFESTHRRRDND